MKSKDNYDPKKKFYNFNDVLETLFKVAVKTARHLHPDEGRQQMAGGFYKISFDGELLVNTPQTSRTSARRSPFEKPVQDLRGVEGRRQRHFQDHGRRQHVDREVSSAR
jgi:hypothetical protein